MKDDYFKGKTYLIFGANGGLGYAVALELSEKGAVVIASDETKPNSESEIFAGFIKADITDYASVCKALAKADQIGVGVIDGVINAVGVQYAGLFADIEIEKHMQTVRVNLQGFVNVAHASYQYLRDSQGSLIMFASVSAAYGPPEFSSYAATKAGVVSLTETLSLEWRNDNIHVASVIPFFVDTPLTRANLHPLLVREVGPNVHTPQEVAVACLKGIQGRKRLIFPSFKPRLIWFLSRQLSFIAPTMMRLTWQKKFFSRIWRRK